MGMIQKSHICETWLGIKVDMIRNNGYDGALSLECYT